MMLSALAAEANELDLLFLVSEDRMIGGDALSRFESQLQSQWGVRAKVMFCPLTEPKVPAGGFRMLVDQLLNAASQRKRAPTFRKECRRAVEYCLERNPDLLFVFCLSAMGSVLSVQRKLPPLVFDLNDVEHVKALRGEAPRFSRKRLSALLSVPSLVRFERRALSFAKKGLVCSEQDRHYLSRWFRLSNIEVVPNAVDLPQKREGRNASPTVGFIGYLPYRPNKMAAEELISRIWPLVRDQVPNAKLVIAGTRPDCLPSFVRAKVDPDRYAGVEFTGFVSDLSEFYDRVQVVCCPIRAGGGTRLKIIEAAAHGLPVVATRVAAEGLAFESGSEIILEERPNKIAEACTSLLLNPVRRRTIGSAARAKVSASYDISTVIDSLRQILRNVVADNNTSNNNFSLDRATS
jgi:glycosyltransferase involved in cell wall biosynthesis